VRQIPIPFRVIQPVTHHKFVGDREAHVIGAHRRDPPLLLVQQYCHPQSLRPALFKHTQQILQRQPGIQNIFNYNHRPALDIRIEVPCEFHLP